MTDRRSHVPARWLATSVALSLCGATAAVAHTPYLLPNAFDVQGPRITLVGSLTEDDYFTPDIALTTPAYVEITPDGKALEVKPQAMLKAMAVSEIGIEAAGTYRFSTGQSVGRTQTFAKVGDAWKMVRTPRPGGGPGGPGGEGRPQGEGRPAGAPGGPPMGGGDGPTNSIAQADVPAGAPTMQAQGVTVVETYVTKGAPTEAALKTTGQGFELKPSSHPNAVYVDQAFAFQLLVDGKAAAGLPISVYRAGNIYDDRRIAVETRSDAKGMAAVKFDRPGVYLITTRTPNQAKAPGEPPPARSYTYSLTLEVTR